MRLDKYITERFNLKSRQYAQTLIKENCVFIDGAVINKASAEVFGYENIEINDYLAYVGRGGLKLEKALNVFSIDVGGMTAMDIGASTGGFTDCLLQNGAEKVYAIDVGHDQLADKLRNDSRVVNLENTNIKDINPSEFDNINIIVVDVSFISLGKIASSIALFKPDILICLIKPQFENAKTNKNGIVKDKSQYKSVISSVAESFSQVGLYISGLTVSPIKGGDGNVEFLSCFSKEKGIVPVSELIRSVMEKEDFKF